MVPFRSAWIDVADGTSGTRLSSNARLRARTAELETQFELRSKTDHDSGYAGATLGALTAQS